MVNASWAGFTLTAPVVVVVYLVGAYILSWTKFGRYTYAVGGDPLSARRPPGIAVARSSTTAIFLFMSMMVVGRDHHHGAVSWVRRRLARVPTSSWTAIIAVIIGGSRRKAERGAWAGLQWVSPLWRS